MDSDYKIKIYEYASQWAKQLENDPSFTDADTEELKGHLIDLTEEFRASGLSDEEAFFIASSRLGDTSILRHDFENANSSIIQMRKIILVLSGIMAYFLLYFLALVTVRLSVLVLFQTQINPVQNIRFIFSLTAVWHLFLIIATIVIHRKGEKFIHKIINLNIKPFHTSLLFAGIIILAIFNQWFYQIIRSSPYPGCNTHSHLYSLFDYFAYTFPLVTISCFVFLFRKYHSNILDELITTPPDETQQQASNKPIFFLTPEYQTENHEELKKQLDKQYTELAESGLDEDEIRWVAFSRLGLINVSPIEETPPKTSRPIRLILLISSGVLIYFFLYYFLFASARILFTILQHFENDPILNIKRTWSYVVIYQLIFVFFTASLYLLDKNIIQLVKRIHIKPKHPGWIFALTIIMATIDRCFYPIVRNAIGQDHTLRNQIGQILYITEHSFPFILGTCFLILFYKYYRDNIRIY